MSGDIPAIPYQAVRTFNPFDKPIETETFDIPASLIKQPIPETVCQEAQRIVYGDRERTYGHPSKNFDNTALLWTAHLRAKYGSAPQLDCFDVAWMMMQLKQARQMHAPKRDNVVDAIGYIACVQKILDYTPPAAGGSYGGTSSDDNRSEPEGHVS